MKFIKRLLKSNLISDNSIETKKYYEVQNDNLSIPDNSIEINKKEHINKIAKRLANKILYNNSMDLDNRDSFFDEAARLVVSYQQASTSLIQRNFSIGYNRSGRLIDQLEDAGIVGHSEGLNPRKVIISDKKELEFVLSDLNYELFYNKNKEDIDIKAKSIVDSVLNEVEIDKENFNFINRFRLKGQWIGEYNENLKILFEWKVDDTLDSIYFLWFNGLRYMSDGYVKNLSIDIRTDKDPHKEFFCKKGNLILRVPGEFGYYDIISPFDCFVSINFSNLSTISDKMILARVNNSENKISEYLNKIEETEKEKIREEILEKERIRNLKRQVKAELAENKQIRQNFKRMHIPQDVQDMVWNRDGGKCVYCGSNEKLEFDHIIPLSRGGSNTYRNLQLLCENCNRVKSDKIG